MPFLVYVKIGGGWGTVWRHIDFVNGRGLRLVNCELTNDGFRPLATDYNNTQHQKRAPRKAPSFVFFMRRASFASEAERLLPGNFKRIDAAAIHKEPDSWRIGPKERPPMPTIVVRRDARKRVTRQFG